MERGLKGRFTTYKEDALELSRRPHRDRLPWKAFTDCPTQAGFCMLCYLAFQLDPACITRPISASKQMVAERRYSNLPQVPEL